MGYSRKRTLPMHAIVGPNALANAPSDLKMPNTVPFWSWLPYCDINVVMHVTTNAVAEKLNCVIIEVTLGPRTIKRCEFFHSQIANNIIPAYSNFPSSANPTRTNAGTIKYSPKTADFWIRCAGNRRTTDPCSRAITTPVVTNIFAWSIDV